MSGGIYRIPPQQPNSTHPRSHPSAISDAGSRSVTEPLLPRRTMGRSPIGGRSRWNPVPSARLGSPRVTALYILSTNVTAPSRIDPK